MGMGKKPNMGRGTKPRRNREYGNPGNGALKKGSAFKKSGSSTKVGRRSAPGYETKKNSTERSASTIKRLNMYRQKAPKKEQLIKQALQPKRIAPDRRWFGNTRVITQDKMQSFREELSKSINDPFSVVLKRSRLPLALLQDSTKTKRMDLLSIESYEHTFGSKRQRKKPKLASYDLDNLVLRTEEKEQNYEEGKDSNLQFDTKTGLEIVPELKHCKEEIFDKGTSRRIWGELYKVIDSSDVIIEVIDARDPMGTRCLQLEREVRKNHPHKHIILLLNKVDLIPTWATKRWVEELRKEFPCIAFHASITHPFGKSALFQLLRQFLTLLKDRKHVSVGFIGYPNVGKSSVINTLKKKKVCKAAPIPGETKVWQYIALTKKLYCIDCPGIVPPSLSDLEGDTSKVLKGVVRAEKIQDPSNYIDEVLGRVKPCYIMEKYKLPKDTVWEDGEDFLSILGRKMGKLRRGGEPDIETTARIVLYDWQRGRIPFFTPPPERITPDAEPKEEKQHPVSGDQSFNDLKCSMQYDADDCANTLEVEEITTIKGVALKDVLEAEVEQRTEMETADAARGTEMDTRKQRTEMETADAARGTEMDTQKQGTEMETADAAKGTTVEAAAATAAATVDTKTVETTKRTTAASVKAAAATKTKKGKKRKREPEEPEIDWAKVGEEWTQS